MFLDASRLGCKFFTVSCEAKRWLCDTRNLVSQHEIKIKNI